MNELLERILGRVGADYADLRYEVKREVGLSFQGKALSELGASTTDGFVLRVLHRGGYSTVAFNRPADADAAIRKAMDGARTLAERAPRPVRLAPAEAVVDEVAPNLVEDPATVPLEEKLAVVRRLNDIALGHARIATTSLRYRDTTRQRWLATTAGAMVREDLVTTSLLGTLVSSDGTLLENVRVGAGGSDGFQNVRGQEAHFEERTKLAVDLLRAQPARGGTYDCILSPELAGVFAHEAFGHFSEADLIEDLPAMRRKMQIGAHLGSSAVSIVDDPTRPGQLGHYRYDDEGVAATRVQLMKSGVLTGRLHSRRTAAEFDERLTGHCVAEDYRYPPIVRMGCIYIEPGLATFDELVARLGDGLYVVDAKGGQTAGETFSFGAQAGYVVRRGRVAELVRDLNVSGNLYRTLGDIEAVGDDLAFCKAGACGKGQANIRSCLGAPHILVRGLVAGGA